MKKVIYSITRIGKKENTKYTGVGYITDEELITAGISKNNKPYIRIYDCVKDCHPIIGTENEFKGAYFELTEYEGHDVEINYYIWYKFAE